MVPAKVFVYFGVDKTGASGKSTIVSSDLWNEHFLGQCMKKRIATWRFSPALESELALDLVLD